MSVLIDGVQVSDACAWCIFESDGECLLKHRAVEPFNKPEWCPVHAVSEEIDVPIYDKETRIENCTVQILENTKTERGENGFGSTGR